MKTFWHHIWFRPVGHVSKTCRPALEHLAVAGVQLVLLVLLVLPPPPLPHPAGHLLLQVGEHPGHKPVELFLANWIVIQLTECNNVLLFQPFSSCQYLAWTPGPSEAL